MTARMINSRRAEATYQYRQLVTCAAFHRPTFFLSALKMACRWLSDTCANPYSRCVNAPWFDRSVRHLFRLPGPSGSAMSDARRRTPSAVTRLSPASRQRRAQKRHWNLRSGPIWCWIVRRKSWLKWWRLYRAAVCTAPFVRSAPARHKVSLCGQHTLSGWGVSRDPGPAQASSSDLLLRADLHRDFIRAGTTCALRQVRPCVAVRIVCWCSALRHC